MNDSPWGLNGPKGMGPKVVSKIYNAFKKALEDKNVVDTLLRFDMLPNYKNSADHHAAVLEQIKQEEVLLGRLNLLRKP